MAEKKLGKYKVLSVVGAGSMGVVYRGEDPEIERPVALKTLYKITPTANKSVEVIIEKVRHEARLAGNLRHPNIVRIYEVSSDSDTPFIVMDLVEGEPLDALIKNRNPLAPELVLRIVEQVASALDYAHSLGIIHRDIKPANILVDSSQRVSIVDFGVAAILDIIPGAPTVHAGAKLPIVGSAGYMAPEQIKGELDTSRSDLSSLAVVTFECLTAVRPFIGDTAPVVMESIKNGVPTPICSLRDTLDPAVQEVFDRALSKDPLVRCPFAKDFVTALRPFLSAADTARGGEGVYVSAAISSPNGKGSVVAEKGATTSDLYSSQGEELRTRGSKVHSPASIAIQDRLEQAVRRVRVVSLVLGITCITAIVMTLWSVARYGGSGNDRSTVMIDSGGDVSTFSNERILTLIAQRGDQDTLRLHELLTEAIKRRISAVAPLIPRYLRSPDSQIVLDAIQGCAVFSQINCKIAITSLINNPDRQIRLAVIQYLQRRGARSALSTQLFKESDPEVEKALREALNAP